VQQLWSVAHLSELATAQCYKRWAVPRQERCGLDVVSGNGQWLPSEETVG
jgi:hypothetical protein